MGTDLYGGIEAGGTKFVCAVAGNPWHIQTQIEIPTTSPEQTLSKVITFFNSQPPLKRLGIASFGPLDLNPKSPTFGSITAKPKPGWSHTDLFGSLRKSLPIPILLDTDVNCAALAEHAYGAGKGLDSLVYITVGTGLGGSSIVDNKLLSGFTHQE